MPHAAYPDLAQLAYAAYAQSTGGRTFDGRPMPAFEDLGDSVTTAWQAAAQAVVTAVREADEQDGFTELQPAPQVPSVGCVVLVAMDPATNNGATVAAAVVTRAWNERTVNVCVLPDHTDGTVWRTSVTYAPDLAALAPDAPGRLGCWTWPPRV